MLCERYVAILLLVYPPLSCIAQQNALKEMRSVRKAVHAFKRIIHHNRRNSGSKPSDAVEQREESPKAEEDVVSGSLSRVETRSRRLEDARARLSGGGGDSRSSRQKKGHMRNKSDLPPRRSRLRLSQLETASTGKACALPTTASLLLRERHRFRRCFW